MDTLAQRLLYAKPPVLAALSTGSATKFCAIAMAGGMQMAIETPLRNAPQVVLQNFAISCVSKVMGSMLLIGQIGQTGIYTGFGHHHIGLTGGPKTGRILVDMIAEKRSNRDFEAFNPMRFT